MKRLPILLVVIALVWSAAARAESPDAQYVRIYSLIQQADMLDKGGQPKSALEKYLEAQGELKRLQTANPGWNEKVIKFRLNFLAEKLTAAEPAPVVAVPAKSEAKPETTSAPAPAVAVSPSVDENLAKELRTVTEQNRQLEADRRVLEAKLREALSAQPAAVDPRTLAKAEDRAAALEKEIAALKATLQEARAKGIDPAALEQTQKALADANARLATQQEAAETLKLEKQALQNRLQAMSDSVPVLQSENELLKKQLLSLQAEQAKTGRMVDSSLLEQAQRAVQDANAKLREQTESVTVLKREKDTLEAQLRTLNKSMPALQKENAALKQQVSKLKARPDLSKAEQQLAANLQSTRTELEAQRAANDALRSEKTALEQKLAQAARVAAVPVPVKTPEPVAAPVLPTKTSEASAGAKRIKQLERERAELLQKLEAATRVPKEKKPREDSAKVKQLNAELTALNARLSVLEAKKVPYTPEELALFQAHAVQVASLVAMASTDAGARKAGPPTVVKETARPVRKTINDLPPGAGPLVAEAQRAFVAHRYEEAEAKYTQVLRLDENNVFTLVNLAATQMEQNKLVEAEKNLNRALAGSPEDPHTLSQFGYLKFRQEKFDEALDALSRSAKIEPNSAVTQNYLGIVLVEKGLRAQAEVALRKAIQVEPGYVDAHYNLAVVYATQEPPFLSLARFHYQKSLAAGHPKSEALENKLNATPPAATATPAGGSK